MQTEYNTFDDFFSSFSSCIHLVSKNKNTWHCTYLPTSFSSLQCVPNHHRMCSCSGHIYRVTEITLDCLTFIIIDGEYMGIWAYADTRCLWGYTRNGPCQGMITLQKVIINCTKKHTLWSRCYICWYIYNKRVKRLCRTDIIKSC